MQVSLVLQQPFKQVRYSLVGAGPAPVFFAVDEESGEVRVQRNLREDDSTVYTVISSISCFIYVSVAVVH